MSERASGLNPHMNSTKITGHKTSMNLPNILSLQVRFCLFFIS